MNKISFYHIDSNYADYLRSFDSRVPIVDKRDGSRLRPLVGIVLTIDNCNFYAPIASPKPKHILMKDSDDLVKIDGGIYGVVNLNNMIPADDEFVTKLDPTTYTISDKSDIDYKEMHKNELTWLNITENRNKIINKATKLLEAIRNGKARPELVSRCCDFDKLIEKSACYKKP